MCGPRLHCTRRSTLELLWLPWLGDMQGKGERGEARRPSALRYPHAHRCCTCWGSPFKKPTIDTVRKEADKRMTSTTCSIGLLFFAAFCGSTCFKIVYIPCSEGISLTSAGKKDALFLMVWLPEIGTLGNIVSISGGMLLGPSVPCRIHIISALCGHRGPLLGAVRNCM